MAKDVFQAISNSTKWEILVETVHILARHNPHSPSLLALSNLLQQLDRTDASEWNFQEIQADLAIALYLALPLTQIIPAIQKETSINVNPK